MPNGNALHTLERIGGVANGDRALDSKPIQLAWNPGKWGAAAVPQTLAAIGPNAVVAAAAQTSPVFIIGATHPRTQAERWDYTFYAYYAIRLNGWIITLAAHQHIDTTGAQPQAGPGNMYIPGYGGWSTATTGAFMGDFPQYDPNVHVNGWVDDAAFRDAYFQGNNRYPRATDQPDFP